jgi:hypothetical protein
LRSMSGRIGRWRKSLKQRGESSGLMTGKVTKTRCNDGCGGRGPGGWSGRNGERGADLGFEGERASGKLCLVLSGIARANLHVGMSAGRDRVFAPTRIAAKRALWLER